MDEVIRKLDDALEAIDDRDAVTLEIARADVVERARKVSRYWQPMFDPKSGDPAGSVIVDAEAFHALMSALDTMKKLEREA